MDKYLQKIKEEHPSLFEHVMTEEEVSKLDKQAVIDQICKHHPGAGTERGFSWYVGGMADTGAWIPEKMKFYHEDELRKFLNELNRSQEKSNECNIQNLAELARIDDLPEPERTEVQNKKWQENADEQKRLWKEMSEEFEARLLWGDMIDKPIKHNKFPKNK